MQPTQRYKLTIAYRGTRYHGWQVQQATDTYKGPPPAEGRGIPTVQGSLQRAMGEVCGHPVSLSGSSRTDAGVHAKGQVAHFDTPSVQIPPEGMRRAINARLPPDILVRAIEPVPDTFDAIRSTAANAKAGSHRTTDGHPAHTLTDLLADLATLTRNQLRIGPSQHTFPRLSTPTPLQARALELLDVKLTA